MFAKEYIRKNPKCRKSNKTHRVLVPLDDPDKYILTAKDIPLPQYWYLSEL